MLTFPERFAQIIRCLGKTEAERAAKIGYTVRQLDNWEKGGRVVTALERLERAGVIHLNDGSCPCSKQPQAEPITA
jgi:transcriptional regulator with XRE-family HTH domain